MFEWRTESNSTNIGHTGHIYKIQNKILNYIWAQRFQIQIFGLYSNNSGGKGEVTED